MANLTPYQLDALNYEKHISLTANAGSGKTFVLARRFLAILLEKDIDLDNVVAITFTEKAAAELYKKIADELEARIKEESDEKLIKKLERIRRQLVSAKISTIHSFCTDLLREFSPEAGVDANFSPIDNRLSDELINAIVEEMISDLIRNEGELFNDLKNLVRLFGSRNFVSKHLKYLIARRSTIINLHEQIYSKSCDEIAKYFNSTFIKYFNKIFGDVTATIIKQIEQINSVVLQTAKNTNLAEEIKQYLEIEVGDDLFLNIIKLKELLEIILTGNGKVRSRGYLSKSQKVEYSYEIEEIENFAAEFKVFDFDENYAETEKQLAKVGQSLINLWKEALQRYEYKKHQLRYLDFEDLLLVTQDLLKRKDVIEYLSKRYKYFMIDEYQDTNETQYNIFIPILDYLKRGNLFIVGDEKQSIYMFRGADLEIFKKTQEEIKKATDDNSLLELPHSFRLSPELTLFTNRLFSRLFDNPVLLYNEVKYNELICAKSSSEKSEIEFLISEKDDASDNESELIAKKIIELTNKNKIELKDIAILSRKRKAFTEVEKALIKYRIPYLIYGGKGFFQRQEIYDVFNYLSFLTNPNNDAALIGILRSPFFTLSDTELFELSLEVGSSYFERLKILSKKKQKLYNIYQQLSKHIQLARTMQISMLIREVLMDTGYWVVLSSKDNSLQYISNIEKLITAANDFSGQGLKTLFDFVNYLEDAIKSTEDESQAALLSTDNVVKLMTIHASKGLEFPVVFLIDTNSVGIDDKVKSKGINIDKNFGILTRTPLNDDYFSKYHSAPIVCIHNYITRKKTMAELKRLLYVGITRAENSLFITASIKRNKDGELNPSKGSFLHLLKEGLSIDDFDHSTIINGTVNFMLEQDDKFIRTEKDISISIPVINHISISEIKKKENQGKNNLDISTQVITDLTKNEIISATKISVFNQCPFKYYLIYELGYSQLHSRMSGNNSFVDYSKEDDDELSANVRGSIIHKLLEEDIPLAILRERTLELLKSFDEIQNKEEKNKTVNSIYESVKNYYSSEVYNKLKEYKNFKNEFEIYTKINDYFIYGIIDKVVFNGDSVLIFDYKTDNLKKFTAKEKLENYKAQLMFYALLISKLLKNVKQITCSLIFIEEPDSVPFFTISPNELKNFEENLSQIAYSMRNGIFKTNTSHCKSCYFSDSKNECVVKH